MIMLGRPVKSKTHTLSQICNQLYLIDYTFCVTNLAFIILPKIWHFSLKSTFNFVKMVFAVIHF